MCTEKFVHDSAQSRHQLHPRSASMLPSSNTGSFKRSVTEALAHTSVMPVTSAQLSDPSLPVDSKPSPESLTLNSTGQRQTDISEMAVVSPGPPVFLGEMRNQQNPEGSLLIPSEQQPHPSADHTQHTSLGSVPTFSWPAPPPLAVPPTESTGASQVTVSPGDPIDLSVFDWKSFSNPLVETTISMSTCRLHCPSWCIVEAHFLGLIDQPASIYVPSSDLAPLKFGLPDPLYTEQSTEKGHNPLYPLEDLGSLEDFSLLQFPIPTTLPPDVSTSPASFYNSAFASSEMDWSAINDFINQFTSFSAESSSAPSPSSTIDAAPSTPENPIGSLLPPPPHEADKPMSILDPSIPPSAFLPPEPGIFNDDASSMWSLCGLSWPPCTIMNTV
jgi:hypothetical protein